ncbi:hypothetical protein PUMCH_002054 [Australozyma saopauloensis]|uniref:Chromosome segregation in meiosis protein 3 domain-containing protein n=1 Tax=Australozyma saopauloensis TaxID=291208 RepID=A0AAX4H8M2_9ASCO|nr:hypothetical protein PUMCH_002054 [[Candida] saopauloensis]
MESQEQDALGLEQPMKLGRVSRIPKLTDDLLFDNIRGLPQVRNNYTKLSALLKRLDRVNGDKIKKAGSKTAARQLKLACATEKLQKVVLFYQLWCHGLFPRATFKDCIQMLRNHKSFALKEYRRGLISSEIHRLKVEKGIIAEDNPSENDLDDDELYLAPQSLAAEDAATTESNGHSSAEPVPAVDDEDDWGFLSIRRTNQLFVGDDEEEDELGLTQNPVNKASGRNKVLDDDDDDDELDELNDDDDDFQKVILQSQNLQTQQNLEPDLADFEEQASDHENELEIMREMGM